MLILLFFTCLHTYGSYAPVATEKHLWQHSQEIFKPYRDATLAALQRSPYTLRTLELVEMEFGDAYPKFMLNGWNMTAFSKEAFAHQGVYPQLRYIQDNPEDPNFNLDIPTLSKALTMASEHNSLLQLPHYTPLLEVALHGQYSLLLSCKAFCENRPGEAFSEYEKYWHNTAYTSVSKKKKSS
ncbi:MAG: hypothetical protein OXC30_01350 [Alphaproteobacteria bacterium]|nr:hypothetical protein [Alphaproteobacteria bacterium]